MLSSGSILFPVAGTLKPVNTLPITASLFNVTSNAITAPALYVPVVEATSEPPAFKFIVPVPVS